MDMELISIIVPVYNVEKYLRACIVSLRKQTYKNIEIILIDDGSCDSSGKICDELSVEDSRIIVIHKNNCGLSSARNRGLEIARGSYVTFVDSDDYVSPDYVEQLYWALKENDAQISICDYQKVQEFEEFEDLYQKVEKIKEILFFTKQEAIKNVYKSTIHGMDFISVAKLYNINLINQNHIRFPVGKIHEDTFTTYKALYAANLIVYVNVPMYFYRIREGSITNSNFSLKRLDKLEATREECEFFLSINELELLKVAFFDHLHETKIALKAMEESHDCMDNEAKKVAKYLKDDIKKYSRYISIPIKKNLYYRLLAVFPHSFLTKL